MIGISMIGLAVGAGVDMCFEADFVMLVEVVVDIVAVVVCVGVLPRFVVVVATVVAAMVVVAVVVVAFSHSQTEALVSSVPVPRKECFCRWHVNSMSGVFCRALN